MTRVAISYILASTVFMPSMSNPRVIMVYVLQRACHSADKFHERTERKKCQKKRKGNYGPEGLKLPAE